MMKVGRHFAGLLVAFGILPAFLEVAYAQTDEQMIRDRFAAAVAEYNARSDIDAFMSYVSPDYLDEGEDYDDWRASILDQWADPDFETTTYTVEGLTVNGDHATMLISWEGETEPETMYFHKESGNWFVYGNQQVYEVDVDTTHLANLQPPQHDTYINLMVADPKEEITSVEVSGPGLADPVFLNERVPEPGSDEEYAWVSWSTGPRVLSVSPSFTTDNRPAVGSEYTFRITNTNRAVITETAAITGYVDVFPSNLFPAEGDVITTPTPVLSWTGVGPDYTYDATVQLEWGAEQWRADNLTTTSIQYDGPPLARNTRYMFVVRTEDQQDNNSLIWVDFSYNTLVVETTDSLLAYEDGDGAVVVDPGVTLTNVDGTEVAGASVTIGNGYFFQEDSLDFTPAHGISGGFDSGTGILTLTGTASTADYQDVLRSVTYTNTAVQLSPHLRTVSFEFHDDGGADSTVDTRQIDVRYVDDPPTLSTVDVLTGTQSGSGFDITHATLLAASDGADEETSPVSFRVESVDSGTLHAGGTPVTVGGSVLTPGSTWTWHPPAMASGVLDAFKVTAWDGNQPSATPVQVRIEVESNAEIAVSQNGSDVSNNTAVPFDFGTVDLYDPAPEYTFTITNSGTGQDLTLGTVALLNNQGFAVTQQPDTTVAAGGGQTTFVIQMNTTLIGAKSAQVRFSNNDPDDDPFTFPLSGTVDATGDTNGNGIDDAWETFWFGHTDVVADTDDDGDGWSNWQEYDRGTDPTRYVLRLEEGWNLVSLARVPRANSVTDIFGNHHVGLVYVWNEDHYNVATELKPLRGYWVYVPTPVEIDILLP